MANVDVEIAARHYTVACRDGEEEHLRAVAALVDRKAHDAAEALGSLSETRQLLFASLLLADELQDHRAGRPPPPEAELPAELLGAMERLAERMERLADRLEAPPQAS